MFRSIAQQMTAIGLPARCHYYAAPHAARERGVALVMAMVMLLILTILGLAAISTSSLEEKMAGNIQEQTRAFQAAESGINSIMRDTGVLNPNSTVNRAYTYSGQSGSAAVQSTFKQYTPPSRTRDSTKIYSATNFQAAHFDIKSTGTTLTNAKSVHYQGIEQLVTKSE